MLCEFGHNDIKHKVLDAVSEKDKIRDRKESKVANGQRLEGALYNNGNKGMLI